MIVTFFQRHKRPEFNSIEELFGAIINELEKNVRVKICDMPMSGASIKVLLRNIVFSYRNKGEINHITGDIHYVALGLGKNTVLTIHDIRSALTGGFLRRLFIKLFWFWIPALIVKKITVISEFSKAELEEIIPFAKNKIHVVHNTFNLKLLEDCTESRVFDSNCPRILLLGTKSNKNLERTIRALKDVKCKVQIIGKLSTQQLNLLKEFNINYENNFNLPYSRIIDLYRSSDIVCFASLYEGFGMPIIEAQACGKPVITSSIGVMPEIAAKGALYVDPHNIDSIRVALNEIINNEVLRGQIVDFGYENIKRFDPERIAKKYLDVYKEVVK